MLLQVQVSMNLGPLDIPRQLCAAVHQSNTAVTGHGSLYESGIAL